MKISNAPVYYQTHVRPSQVRDMIGHCHALNKACHQRLTELRRGVFFDAAKRPGFDIVAMHWLREPEVIAFHEAALNNHFVCSGWKCFDQLKGDAYRSREELLQNPSFLPKEINFAWIRRFIHSVVTWENNPYSGSPRLPTLQLAWSGSWWVIAAVLKRELDAFEASNEAR